MFFVCSIPLIIVSFFLIRGYQQQEAKERQEEVVELCMEFANRIQNTGYLMNTAQIDLSVSMDTAAQIYDGRIFVVNLELQILKDTFHREEGKTMISEEVVKALCGQEILYVYDYDETTEIICQIISG